MVDAIKDTIKDTIKKDTRCLLSGVEVAGMAAYAKEKGSS